MVDRLTGKLLMGAVTLRSDTWLTLQCAELHARGNYRIIISSKVSGKHLSASGGHITVTWAELSPLIVLPIRWRRSGQERDSFHKLYCVSESRQSSGQNTNRVFSSAEHQSRGQRKLHDWSAASPRYLLTSRISSQNMSRRDLRY